MAGTQPVPPDPEPAVDARSDAAGVAVPAADPTAALPVEHPVLRAFGDRISGILAVVQIVVLCASGMVILWEITCRYWLRNDFAAATDVLTFLFGWLVFLGLPRAIWRDSSPRMGLMRSYPASVAGRLRAAGSGATITYFVIQFWSYLSFFTTQRDTRFPSLGLPYYYASIAVPVTNALCVLLLVNRVLASGRPKKGLLPTLAGAGFVAVVSGLPISPQLAALVSAAVLLLLDAPIAVALGVAGEAMILNGSAANISAAATQLLVPMNNIALLAVPLFMLMGALFANSRLAGDLSVFVRSLVGWLPGGLGVGCVGTAAVFANVSGSAIADTAAIGNVYIPEMVRAGYRREAAAAVQAAAGVIGVVFPPAVAMILFASVASINVIPVFEAVVLPGTLLALTMAVIAVVLGARSGIPTTGRFRAGRVVRSLPRAVPVLLVPIILDGGIFSGIFTPSESGAVAIVFAIAVILVVRGATRGQMRRALVNAVDGTTMVMFILTGVSLLNYGFITSGLAAQVNSAMSLGGGSQLGVLLVINLIFIVAHVFMETAPAILVLVPLVLPAALAAGVSPLHLAVVVAINSTIGQILPPVGVSLYVSSDIAKVEARDVVRSILPYVLGSTIVLVLVTVFPVVSLWLPQKLT